MSHGQYILDESGEPIKCESLKEWGEWMGRIDRSVVQTILDTGTRISTVFLGLDHGHGSGPPLLYETMVFGGPMNQEEQRYSTRREALAGHARMQAVVTEQEIERAEPVCRYCETETTPSLCLETEKGLACTRPRGHEGEHAACGAGAEVEHPILRWEGAQ